LIRSIHCGLALKQETNGTDVPNLGGRVERSPPPVLFGCRCSELLDHSNRLRWMSEGNISGIRRRIASSVGGVIAT
jgi:hypothetical protein